MIQDLIDSGQARMTTLFMTEDAYAITGGNRLKGRVTLSGAKNVALKTIIAALMFDSKVMLENVPKISDVIELLHLIRKLGVKVEFTGKNTLEIDSSGLAENKVDLLHGSKTRVSYMLFAPLLYRFKKCFIPNPGGCRIGARPIDRIVDGMEKLGALIVYNHDTGYYEAYLENSVHGHYRFQKPSHTGTELLIMFAVFGNGEILLENTALEPEIDELINFLNEGGAEIKREGKNIRIRGKDKLHQRKSFHIIPDSNEAVTFAVLGIASKGEVIIENPPVDHLTEFINKVKETGNSAEKLKDNTLRFAYKGKIKPVSIETAPHPGFKTDWQPNWAVLMTQAKGISYIHEKVFENRFSYVTELQKLGAHVSFETVKVDNPEEFYDFYYEKNKGYQQKIKIIGGHLLHGGALHIWDLRAGASLVIAALIANGGSVVNGASIFERGYEDFSEKVQNLGGKIRKV